MPSMDCPLAVPGQALHQLAELDDGRADLVTLTGEVLEDGREVGEHLPDHFVAVSHEVGQAGGL